MLERIKRPRTHPEGSHNLIESSTNNSVLERQSFLSYTYKHTYIHNIRTHRGRRRKGANKCTKSIDQSLCQPRKFRTCHRNGKECLNQNLKGGKILSGQQWRGQGKPRSAKGIPCAKLQRHKIAELFRELKSCNHPQHFPISSLVDS